MTVATDRWVVKQRYPNESLCGIFYTEEKAQEWADKQNADYQSDKYYVEPYIPAKFQQMDYIKFAQEFTRGKENNGDTT